MEWTVPPQLKCRPSDAYIHTVTAVTVAGYTQNTGLNRILDIHVEWIAAKVLHTFYA